jgi:hypothetical protein
MIFDAQPAGLREIVLTSVTTITPVILFFSKAFMSNKKEADKRHAENVKKLDEILEERKYLPAHSHQEFYTGDPEEPLTVKGIIRRQQNGNR